MNIYDKETGELIESPDLENGYTEPGKKFVAHHEAEEEKWDYQILPGTSKMNEGKGLKGLVLISPAKAAYDEYEDCLFYVKYTQNDISKAIENKIKELTEISDSTIYEGTDVLLSDGYRKRFTYTLKDQADVSDMFNAVLLGMSSYIYHADDEDCEVYSSKDILSIYSALSSYKTAQKTYLNQLCRYVKTLSKISEIKNVSYGQALTGDYLNKYNTLIASAQTEMQKAIDKLLSD